MPLSPSDRRFDDAVRGLARGDFDRLAPVFTGPEPEILPWLATGRFGGEPSARVEALTCASFLGAIPVAQWLLEAGDDPAGGSGTGMDALHWAANRRQADAVRLLLRWKAPLETVNMHETTVLGTAIWSAINEPRPTHLEIIGILLDAGARVAGVRHPTGHPAVDALLRHRGLV
jgi:ankyrin repeat protein